MNISSIIVKTSPEFINILIEKLKNTTHVDYHFHDELGNIIVTIETKDTSAQITVFNKIEKLEHVISAQMSYSYSEEELEEEINHLNSLKSSVPDVLQSDIKAKDLKYSGDVENYLKKRRNKNK
ncbi:MAG: chaperone NapD [Campylobacteraceae bacterium]|nr:chaperone NapD [Campylobacteraceae bacterium]